VSIWGHEQVKVEKDVERKCWHVRTMQGGHLCTVPWADAFKEFPSAPDYAAAVATCVGHPKTALTASEEHKVYADSLPPEKKALNVVEVDFKAKKRRT
jgi:hypothetical protein